MPPGTEDCWFAVFSDSDVGHIKDDEKDSIDAAVAIAAGVKKFLSGLGTPERAERPIPVVPSGPRGYPHDPDCRTLGGVRLGVFRSLQTRRVGLPALGASYDVRRQSPRRDLLE
jgi:hypothetical protein